MKRAKYRNQGSDAILDCGHSPSAVHGIGTGYGQDAEGKKYCYACCAERDKAEMTETGRWTGYLTYDFEPSNPSMKIWSITNWPGSLRFRVGGAVRYGRHNIAGKRIDAWFAGPDGHSWHAVNYGDNSEIAHCKRTKERTRKAS